MKPETNTQTGVGYVLFLIVLFLTILLIMFNCTGSQAQCTATIQGDSMSCPGIHRYWTEPGMTGYNWNPQNASYVSTGENWCDIVWRDSTGYIRVTYDCATNWAVMIIGPCISTAIIEHQPMPDSTVTYYDMRGILIPKEPDHGLYIKRTGNKGQTFLKE